MFEYWRANTSWGSSRFGNRQAVLEGTLQFFKYLSHQVALRSLGVDFFTSLDWSKCRWWIRSRKQRFALWPMTTAKDVLVRLFCVVPNCKHEAEKLYYEEERSCKFIFGLSHDEFGYPYLKPEHAKHLWQGPPFPWLSYNKYIIKTWLNLCLSMQFCNQETCSNDTNKSSTRD